MCWNNNKTDIMMALQIESVISTHLQTVLAEHEKTQVDILYFAFINAQRVTCFQTN